MKRISNLQSNTCGCVIHLPRHLLPWDASNPPFNIFWRCLGICVFFALGSSLLQELWSFPCSSVLGEPRPQPHLPTPILRCIVVRMWSTCTGGSWTGLKNQIVGIGLLPIMSRSSICNQPHHTVSSAEHQNSGVWLMLQPHPLDQRHNYIVINFAGSLDFLRCVRLWLLFINSHPPEERECNRPAICGVRDVFRVECSINLCIGLSRRLKFGADL